MKKIISALALSIFLVSGSSVFAEEGAESDKLNQVLGNQEKILAKLEDVLKELQIVKVRASQKG